MKYPKLFAPMQVGTLTFRNRLLSGPNMMCALNPDGSPTDYMVGYYDVLYSLWNTGCLQQYSS